MAAGTGPLAAWGAKDSSLLRLRGKRGGFTTEALQGM
jgi:hypothetical protein